MTEHEDPQGHFFTGLLIGGVLGALAAMFFAPKAGRILRSDIKKIGSEVLKDAGGILADTGKRAREVIEEAKHQAKELKKETDRHLLAARRKMKEILAHGEKKVAAGPSDSP